MADNDYIVVTTVQTFRHRYVMHKDDLRKLNTHVTPTEEDLVEWALDTVTMEACEEFSQLHLDEQIVDFFQCTEEEMLGFFDRDNDYLKEWSNDYKIEWVRKNLKT
jgi:hypothetical protein